MSRPDLAYTKGRPTYRFLGSEFAQAVRRITEINMAIPSSITILQQALKNEIDSIYDASLFFDSDFFTALCNRLAGSHREQGPFLVPLCRLAAKEHPYLARKIRALIPHLPKPNAAIEKLSRGRIPTEDEQYEFYVLFGGSPDRYRKLYKLRPQKLVEASRKLAKDRWHSSDDLSQALSKRGLLLKQSQVWKLPEALWTKWKKAEDILAVFDYPTRRLLAPLFHPSPIGFESAKLILSQSPPRHLRDRVLAKCAPEVRFELKRRSEKPSPEIRLNFYLAEMLSEEGARHLLDSNMAATMLGSLLHRAERGKRARQFLEIVSHQDGFRQIFRHFLQEAKSTTTPGQLAKLVRPLGKTVWELHLGNLLDIFGETIVELPKIPAVLRTQIQFDIAYRRLESGNGDADLFLWLLKNRGTVPTGGYPIPTSRLLSLTDKTGTPLAQLALKASEPTAKQGTRKHKEARLLRDLFAEAPLPDRQFAVEVVPQWQSKIDLPTPPRKAQPSPSSTAGEMAFDLAKQLRFRPYKLIARLIAQAWIARQEGGEIGSCLDHEYRTYLLPKKSGGNRTITVPSTDLKAFQRAILRFLESEPMLECVQGFVKNRSTLTNAAPHAKRTLVVNLDVDSFFPSIKFDVVHMTLTRILRDRFDSSTIRFLAEACCYQGGLAMGAPTSPIVANLVMEPVDKALMNLCGRHGLNYTRYADDLTFSGEGNAKKVIPFARQVLAGIGLQVHEKKLNLFRRGRRQMVTGLVVNERPNLPRKMRRELRAAVHAVCTGRALTWRGKSMTRQSLEGRLAYYYGIDPEGARPLIEQLRAKEATS